MRRRFLPSDPLSAAAAGSFCTVLLLSIALAFFSTQETSGLRVGVPKAAAAVPLQDLQAAEDSDACSCTSLLGSTESGRPLALLGGAVDQVRSNFRAGRRLIVLINYTARNGRHFGQQGATYVQERLLAGLFGCGAHVIDFWEPEPSSAEFRSLTAALQEAALVVVNAEGTLHHKRTPLHHSLELVARHGADVPLWIINASFQYDMSAPLHDTLDIFRHAAFAAIRDGMSHAVLRSALPWAQHVTLSADLTALLPHSFSPDVEKQLAARMPARKGAPRPGDPLRVVLSASAMHADTYTSFWRQLFPLVLASHPNSTFVLALDCNYALSSQPWAGFPAEFLGARFEGLCEYEAMAEVVWALRSADVYIGGRFHAATYALLAGLPGVLLPSNTWKLESWAALVSSPGVEYLPEGVAAGAELVWQRARAVMAQREALAGRDLASMRQLALHNFPIAEPVRVADTVTAEELRMQRVWLAQTEKEQRRSTFCERFGGLEKKEARSHPALLL